jgi:hypothetical protein
MVGVVLLVVFALYLPSVQRAKQLERETKDKEATIKRLQEQVAKNSKKQEPETVVWNGHRYPKGAWVFALYLDLLDRSKTDPRARKLVKTFAVPMTDADGKAVTP